MEEKKKVVKIKVVKPVGVDGTKKSESIINTEELKKQVAEKKPKVEVKPAIQKTTNIFDKEENNNSDTNNENAKDSALATIEPPEAKKTDSPIESVIKTIKSWDRKKQLIAAALALAILVGIIYGFSTSSSSPEFDEALNCVKDYQQMLKLPETMTLRGDVAVLDIYPNDSSVPDTYVFFEASGENSFGGTVSSNAAYINGVYDGKVLADWNESGHASSEALDAWALQMFAETEFEQEYLDNLDASSVTRTFVDGEKIAKKLHINFIADE